MSKPFNALRRQIVLSTATLGLLRPGMLMAAPSPVTVVTSYPDEFVSRIQAAFEKAHPEYRMQVIWRMPNDAADYLKQPGHGGADVYWSASPRTFARLANDGIWQKFPVDRSNLPKRIGNTVLGDEAGYFTASEVAGFGFAVSPAMLAEQQIPTPTDWPDLADPRLAGLIAMPVPARVGFAPPIIEIILQSMGWQPGWALWSEIAANANFVDRGSTFVTDEITARRCAIGISIDFFVNSAIANGAPIKFIYPRHTGLNPAHIAVTRNAPHPHGAMAFVDFMLSSTGQRLLAHPDIKRLPIRADAYAELSPGTFNPFVAAEAGNLQFDSNAARPRLTTSAAIFQQMLVEPHNELKLLWQRVHAAEARGKTTAHIRRLLGTPPIDEAEANNPDLQKQLGQRLEGSVTTQPSAPEVAWQANCRANREAADKKLTEIGA